MTRAVLQRAALDAEGLTQLPVDVERRVGVRIVLEPRDHALRNLGERFELFLGELATEARLLQCHGERLSLCRYTNQDKSTPLLQYFGMGGI